MATGREPGHRPRALLSHLAAGALVALMAALLFASSFKAWGHPVIDLGRDLYLPSQILEGRVLYRDLLYNYGPAAPYLLAAVTAALGDALWVFEAMGLLIGLATLCGLYAIGNQLGGVWTALASVLMFLPLSFFANSTWGCNFVLPYSFAATLGMASALWSFRFLYLYLFERRGSGALASSVTFLLLALLCKQEVGLAIAGVHVVAWCTHRVPSKAIWLTLGASAFIGLLFVAAFWARHPGEHSILTENLTKFAPGSGASGFFASVAGMDRPGANLLRTLAAACKLGLVVALAGAGGLAIGNLRRRRYAAAVAPALALVADVILIWRWADIRIFQATPLLALGVLSYFLLTDRKDPLVLLATFTLLAGLRVLLQYHPMWYGFYLAVPAYVFTAYLLGVRLPEWLPARWFDRHAATAALVALALLLGWRFESSMLESFKAKTSTLATAKGSLRDEPHGRSESINAFLEYAAAQLGPANPTMVVLPEGVSLNYFTGFQNPTAYYLFTPVEIGSVEVERKMIRELDATEPDYLVMTSRDLSEYGRRGIGIDYAMELGDWIRRSYQLERVFEAGASRSWRILLLKRKPSDIPLQDG